MLECSAGCIGYANHFDEHTEPGNLYIFQCTASISGKACPKMMTCVRAPLPFQIAYELID